MAIRITVASCAEEVMQKVGAPMHYVDVYKKIRGKCRIHGKTPDQTVRSRLSTDPRFKRVAEGIYALASWTQYPAVRFAKDIAYDFLRTTKSPQKLQALGDAIKKEREYDASAAQVARNVIKSDKRFYYDKQRNLVGLVEWVNK